MNWKNLSYAKRGSIIGLVVGIFAIIGIVTCSWNLVEGSVIPEGICSISAPFFYPLFYLFFYISILIRYMGGGMFSLIISIPILILFSAFLGSLIGKIVGKIKSKDQNINIINN